MSGCFITSCISVFALFTDMYPLADIVLPPDDCKPEHLPSIAWNPFMDLKRRDDMAKLDVKFPYGNFPEDIQVQ